MLDPGRGKTKTGRLWCYAVDPRTWKGPGHPAAAYIYGPDAGQASRRTSRRLPRQAAGRWLPGSPPWRNAARSSWFSVGPIAGVIYDFRSGRRRSPLRHSPRSPGSVDRGRDPRPAARAPPCRPPAAQPSDRRDVADLAESHTGARVELVAAGGRHPLHAAALVRPGTCSSMTGGWR